MIRFNRFSFCLVLGLSALTRVCQADAQLFTKDDHGQRYFTYSIDQDALSGAPDASSLNHPLTAADRLFVKNGHFFRAGKDVTPFTADDTRVKLYGINLSFATNFPDQNQALVIAKRLKKLGINAVRLHHMDTSPGDATNPPRSILLPGPYPTFNPVAIERLKYFIQVLAQQGIYTNLNLHVAYQFDSTKDGIPAFDHGQTKESYGSSIQVYTPHLIDLQKTYATQLIKALDLKNNPALAMVEINNESSLLSSWTRKEWDIAVPTQYMPILQKQWQAWLISQYGSVDQACKTWGKCNLVVNGQASLLTPEDVTNSSSTLFDDLKTKVKRKLKGLFEQNDLDAAPSSSNIKVEQDFLRFLIATDRTYYNTLRTIIHQATDNLVPVTGTQMRYGGVLNFDSMTNMDYIDEHFYIDHPDFPSSDWNAHDWRIKNTSLDQDSMRMILENALRRQENKPFVISEYSMPFPNQQGAMIQPLLATVAAAQDWDGLFFFDYMDGDNWANTPSNFTLSGDWGKFALTGQSARLFRQTMPALTQSLVIPVTHQARLNITSSTRWSAYENYLEERFNIFPEIAFSKKISIQTDPKNVTLQRAEKPALPWTAPNQAFSFGSNQLFTLNTASAKGIWGFIPSTPVNIDTHLSVSMPDHQRGFATLLMTPIDTPSFDQAHRFLLTITGATTGTQPGSMPARPKQVIAYKGTTGWSTFEPDPDAINKPSGSKSTVAPTWQEQTKINLYVSNLPLEKLTVYPLSGDGKRLQPLSEQFVIRKGNMTEIHLQENPTEGSLWYEIETTPSVKK